MRQRITIWLCLVYAVIIGIAPAQRLVLCLEPDGSIAVESATQEAKCRGCESPSTDVPSTPNSLSSNHEDCPCIDLLIASPDKENTLAVKKVESRVEFPPSPLPVPMTFGAGLVSLRNSNEQFRVDSPRSSPLRPLIRSVVLRV